MKKARILVPILLIGWGIISSIRVIHSDTPIDILMYIGASYGYLAGRLFADWQNDDL